MVDTSPLHVQIKICGLTRPDEARACVDAGADAIGLVFYPPSPRCVSTATARAIVEAIDGKAATVGVFVSADVEPIMERVARCGLTAVQLHADEPPELVDRLIDQSVGVIKTLFYGKPPSLSDGPRYRASAFLAECSGGKLPGGNALTWDWEKAEPIGRRWPLILAGGLTPENVAAAIGKARPDAVDVSSGVESAPGRKDIRSVTAFIEAVARSGATQSVRPIRRLFP